MTKKPDIESILGATASKTFLGLKVCHDFDMINASSVFIGAKGATPYGNMGPFCQNAPDAIRKAIGYMANNIDRYNFDIGGPIFPKGSKPAGDYGNLPFSETNFSENRSVIRATVAKALKAGAVPIVVGGDDSVPIPMLDALADTGKYYTILQIDAHIDWRHSHMDEKLGLSSNMRRASEMAHIKKIIQIGARGIGSAHLDDVQDAQEWGAEIIPADDVHLYGITQIIEHITPGTNIIICFDVDGLDPSIVPGVLARSPGGLTYSQAIGLIKGAASKGTIAAANFTEFLPESDVDGIGAMTVSRVIAATMGVIARQNNKSK
ncbi:MAG: arginase family protein [Paracoccaceae bacterium]|nr:arginase family protein [Paracoccaceae bacterium]